MVPAPRPPRRPDRANRTQITPSDHSAGRKGEARKQHAGRAGEARRSEASGSTRECPGARMPNARAPCARTPNARAAFSASVPARGCPGTRMPSMQAPVFPILYHSRVIKQRKFAQLARKARSHLAFWRDRRFLTISGSENADLTPSRLRCKVISAISDHCNVRSAFSDQSLGRRRRQRRLRRPAALPALRGSTHGDVRRYSPR